MMKRAKMKQLVNVTIDVRVREEGNWRSDDDGHQEVTITLPLGTALSLDYAAIASDIASIAIDEYIEKTEKKLNEEDDGDGD